MAIASIYMLNDTWLNSRYATTNYDTRTGGLIGREYYNDEIARYLCKGDFSSISIDSINSISLKLYLYNNGLTGWNELHVHRVLRNWVTDEATWNIYSTGNNWTSGGCGSSGNDFAATALGTKRIETTDENTWITISLDASEFLKMLDGTYNDYGIRVKQSYEGQGEDADYYFKGGTYPPYFYIDYVEAVTFKHKTVSIM